MNTASQIRPGALYRAIKPVRDREYRRFIKRLPCAACLKTWWVDPCHTGPHGTAQKACDLTCIPLCRPCHREYDTAPQVFIEAHRLDVPALIAKLNQFYRAKIKREAA